jgi:hypothetical protein
LQSLLSLVYDKFNEAILFKTHPFKLFELKENLNKGFDNTNSIGLRNREIEKKEENDVRILCVGGSTTYSSGAKNINSTWPSYFEKYLQKNFIKNIIEVINCGVPAYNLLQNLIDFQTRLIFFNPDIVLIMAGLNDATAILKNTDFKTDYTHICKTFRLPECKIWEYSALLSLLFSNFTTPRNIYIKNKNYPLHEIIYKKNKTNINIEMKNSIYLIKNI